MTAQHHCGYVIDRDVEFLRDKGAEAGGIQNASHADDAVFGEFGNHQCHMRHGIQRIGDHDDNRVGRNGDGLLSGGLDDFVVGEQKIVAAHTRFTGEAGRDDDDIRSGGGGVIVGAGDGNIKAFHGTGLQQVKAFPLGDTFGDVKKDDIAQFLFGGPEGTIGADVAGAYYGDFVSQFSSFRE